MTTTHTDSGGAYYATAVALRADAKRARDSYPKALERAEEERGDRGETAANLHVAALALFQVGYELAASLYCVAQAIEDRRLRSVS